MESKPRSKNPRIVKDVFEGTEEIVYTSSIQTIKLRLMIDAHVKMTGNVSGKSYEWLRAGAVEDVNSEDAPKLLARKRPGSCCGTQTPKYLFEKVI